MALRRTVWRVTVTKYGEDRVIDWGVVEIPPEGSHRRRRNYESDWPTCQSAMDEVVRLRGSATRSAMATAEFARKKEEWPVHVLGRYGIVDSVMIMDEDDTQGAEVAS